MLTFQLVPARRPSVRTPRLLRIRVIPNAKNTNAGTYTMKMPKSAPFASKELSLSAAADQGMAYRVSPRGSSGRFSLRGRVQFRLARSVVEEAKGRVFGL